MLSLKRIDGHIEIHTDFGIVGPRLERGSPLPAHQVHYPDTPEGEAQVIPQKALMRLERPTIHDRGCIELLDETATHYPCYQPLTMNLAASRITGKSNVVRLGEDVPAPDRPAPRCSFSLCCRL